MSNRPVLTVFAAVLSLFSASAVLAQSSPNYHVTKSVALGGPDSWDSVVFDPGSHRVYVAHGNRVTVVDGASGAVVGNVEGFAGGTHGVAVSAANGRGYSNDGKAGTASSFDLTTLKAIKTIKADEDADGIVADPVTGHIFVINGDPGTVTVIDPKTDSVIATINGGAKLEFGVAGDKGKIYVNGEAKKDIVRIDTATNKIDARWPIPGCTSPHGIAVDLAAHRLFSSCVNSVLVVVDTDSGAVVTSVAIGKGSDGAAFDPKRKLIFSSNGADGTISVIQEKDPQTFVALAPIKTAVTGKTMAIDPDSGRIYVAAADVDSTAQTPNGRPKVVPGTLKLMFVDP